MKVEKFLCIHVSQQEAARHPSSTGLAAETEVL